MPNWCDNVATITGPVSVIKEIKEILESNDAELLNYMVPQPNFQGESDWYAWNVENWGTKWDISSPTINEDSDDSISFGFSSAWSPPVTAFETWARGQDNVTFKLDYFEPGMAYAGTATFDGEYFDDECVDYNNDPDTYKTIAREDWGWEDEEEEEEPLTDWYKQGVEDKGLNK